MSGLIQKFLIEMGVNICIRYTLKCTVVTVTNTSNIEEASYVGGKKGGETFKLGGWWWLCLRGEENLAWVGGWGIFHNLSVSLALLVC